MHFNHLQTAIWGTLITASVSLLAGDSPQFRGPTADQAHAHDWMKQFLTQNPLTLRRVR